MRALAAPGTVGAVPTTETACAVVELRRYAMRPGGRDVLAEMFARELVAPQEAAGMRVYGWYRDLDDPDSFVWLRGFADMEARRRALAAFYDGPVWARFRDAANATMVDSDNVLLLRPVAPVPLRDLGHGPLTITIATPTEQTRAAGFAAVFARSIAPAAGEVIGTLVTEHAENTFPRLPVREDADVWVWLTRGDAATARDLWAEPPERLRLA